MFPTTPVMINWHSLKGLSQVRKQWLIDASVAHNIKLKLNIQNQVTAITAITRLDLSNNGLKQVPFCLFQMPSLVVLNLSQNNLQTLPETEEIMSPLEATKSGISRMRKSKSYSSALTSNNSANQPNGLFTLLDVVCFNKSLSSRLVASFATRTLSSGQSLRVYSKEYFRIGIFAVDWYVIDES